MLVLKQKQSESLHERIEEWDLELDANLSRSERDFLHSLEYEKATLKRLATEYSSQKSALKKQHAESIAASHHRWEEAKLNSQHALDGIRTKLESERNHWDGTIHDLAEWILLKTGKRIDALGHLPSGSAGDLPSEIADMSGLAKLFEERKRAAHQEIERLKTIPQIKWLSSWSYHAIGPLIMGIAAAMAYFLGAPLLVVLLTLTVGTLLLTSLLHFGARPIVARAVVRQSGDVVRSDHQLRSLLVHGNRLAESLHHRELERLQQQHQTRLAQEETRYRQAREELTNHFENDRQRVQREELKKRFELTQSRGATHAAINAQCKPQLERLQADFVRESEVLVSQKETELQNLSERFLNSQGRSVERWKRGSKDAIDRMKQVEAYLDEVQPSWQSSIYSNSPLRRDTGNLAWRIGVMNPQLGLGEQAATCNPKLNMGGTWWPVVYDLMSHGSLVLHGGAESLAATDGVLLNQCLRAITSLPAGSIRMLIIDPQGLGKGFSWLMSIADIDPSLVCDRVWTQPTHIAYQLANTARHVEDVIQQSLRSNHRNLFEYNAQAGPMAIPYRLVVWDQFPAGLDESSWQSLCSILASGGRCGVGVVLRLSQSTVWPSFADPNKLSEFGLHLEFSASQDVAYLRGDEFSGIPVRLADSPQSDRVKEIMECHLHDITEIGKVIVPFDSIDVGTMDLQQASSAESLSIPIGISSAGRIQSLKLGVGTSQHVLIAGKTGSGKSSLLHTMITSAVRKYSPEALRLVLLDFKKGVEFQVYSESQLPHADVIGIESKREFGVSTLEYLDRIMHARGELFREVGVQDLASLARKSPSLKMPRILIVIDEFQELFVEDDKLSQQATMLMDRIVRQGRSFGMHLVLASQTLGGAYSLPRTTLAQMAVRIALQCDSSDAMLILSEDNTAAERLRHSGQAIYNESGGRIESNQGFQVAFQNKEEQLERLHSIPRSAIPHHPAVNPLGRQVVFEGHRPATWDSKSVDAALVQHRGKDSSVFAIVLGDSVSIDPPVVKTIARGAGRNCLVVGSEETIAASILACSAYGFLRGESATDGQARRIVLLNGAKPEDEALIRVIQSMSGSAHCEIASTRDLDRVMQQVHSELVRRLENPAEVHPPLLFCVANLGRFRELRKSDDYAFGESSENVKPDAIFSELLRDGPSVGIHVWVWADGVGTVSRWISRQSLRDFEIRILMQMSSNDSNQLIDSNAANRLEPYVALLQDDVDGKPIKFRPFSISTLPVTFEG
jgi:energy-coupling factor transporter ATP-binding protein EcfA2